MEEDYPEEIKKLIERFKPKMDKPIIISHCPCPKCGTPAAFSLNLGRCIICGHTGLSTWEIYKGEE